MAETMDKRVWAQKLVDQFLAREGGGIWVNVDRKKVGEGLKDRVLNPNLINQNKTNLCGIAAFVHQWAKDDPVGYVWLGISLFEAGWGRVGKGDMLGRVVRPSKELKSSRIPYIDLGNSRGREMNHADWLVLSSVREALNGVFSYTADESLFKLEALTLPSEVVTAFKAAGYKEVVEKTNWAMGEGYDNAVEASNKFAAGYRVVILVNSRMLKDETIDTEAALIRTSDHWVGLQSKIEMKLVGKDYKVSPFKLFTWGTVVTVPAKLPEIPLTAFLKNYYGYIAAKY